MRTRTILRRLNHREARAMQPVMAASTRPLTVVSLAVVLGGLFGGVAQAAGADSVLPPGGKAAGESYAYWLAAKEQVFFSGPPAGPKACDTLHAPGGAVGFLAGGGGGGTITCNEPAGRPVYVDGVSNECSTLPGDHNGFGTSSAQLKRCARAGFKGLSGTATLDGVRVANYPNLIVATRVIHIRVPKRNQFGIKAQSGTSAAYGEGLLLSGLSAGPHTLRITSTISGKTNSVTYKLRIPVHAARLGPFKFREATRMGSRSILPPTRSTLPPSPATARTSSR
jgi:hypothetical protein